MGQLSGRSIRTFVLRQGRLTEGQQRSLDQFWKLFGIDVGDGDLLVKKPGAELSQGQLSQTRADERNSTETVGSARIDPNLRFDNNQAPLWMEIGIGWVAESGRRQKP